MQGHGSASVRGPRGACLPSLLTPPIYIHNDNLARREDAARASEQASERVSESSKAPAKGGHWRTVLQRVFLMPEIIVRNESP